MAKKSVDDYLDQGIHGVKEINPEERRKFLGTLRERIVLAMTLDQVREKQVYEQAAAAIKDHKGATLYLNGEVSYEDLSKYIKIAQANQVTFTIVNNQEHITEIGLVLAYHHAVDQEDIYLVKGKPFQLDSQDKKMEKKEGFSLFKWWKN
ncbi:YueI family protein [Bacillus sp. 1P06AnD]|uniref:YueI family protein n=1 Tax=Bacillus sp. 1P06AnD TaxID=3132208 RepID=UPI0039A1ADB5